MDDRIARSRWLMAIALGLATIGCVAMLVLRAGLTGQLEMRSLVWNLFLAVIPFPVAWGVDALGRNRRVNGWLLALPTMVWLVFFPNSPYLVTDLIHLRPTPNVPLWYDSLVFFAFSATGLLLGLTSLYLVQSTVARRLGRTWGAAVALLAIAMGSYGIYLGRVERWNSWDVLTNPRELLRSIRNQVESPLSNRSAIIITVGFAVFLTAVYAIMYAFAHLVRVDGGHQRVDRRGLDPADDPASEDDPGLS